MIPATEPAAKVLIVDDEPYICKMLSRLMHREGFEPIAANDGARALKMIQRESPDVLLLDFRMPGMNGFEVMRRAQRLDPDLPVVMITAYADIHGAVEAMRKGAHDYLAKPFEHHDVIRVVRRAIGERELKQQLKHLNSQLKERFSLRKMMGGSDAVSELIVTVNRVARSGFTIIIEGETGSGKELVARAIHHQSPRAEGPFVAIDCGAIPETLLESELFGHEKGAFTGATCQKPGKFETAKSGTLFLDEIINMPMGSQAKLLRALQERKISRVGGTQEVAVDARLVVATNRDLASCEEQAFRKDLFFRLNEYTIRIPSLRERKEDIVFLAKRFLAQTNIELQKTIQGFSDEAAAKLLTCQWPGNVRQLRSVIRRAVLMADDGIITEKHLDIPPSVNPGAPEVSEPGAAPWQEASLKEIVRTKTMNIERQILIRALDHTGWNKAKTARLLKIDYKTIYNKIKALGIFPQGGEDVE
jgi:two-component system nitrogen regulation response regulator GlnG